jgi:hypothetical protein
MYFYMHSYLRKIFILVKSGCYIGDAGASHFSRLEMIALACISDQCLLFEFLR